MVGNGRKTCCVLVCEASDCMLLCEASYSAVVRGIEATAGAGSDGNSCVDSVCGPSGLAVVGGLITLGTGVSV